MRRLTLSLLGLVVAATPALADPQTIRRAVEGYVVPGYTAFDASARELAGALADLCAQPSDATLDAARRGFRQTVETWGAIEPVRFGPVTQDNRQDRILFWPDRKGIGLKQVQEILTSQDPAATTAEGLAAKSVAVQGFGALEFALFGTGSDLLATDDAAFRCGFGKAVAANLKTMAAAVLAGWAAPDGQASIWTAPGADNPLYRSDAEAMTELVDVLIQGLDMLRDVRLNGFLGLTAERDKPKQAIFWRADATVASLAANVRGLKMLFEASGLAEALPPGDRWLGESALAQFTNAEATLAGLNGPIADILADPARRERLDHFRTITSSLSSMMGTRITGALGLTAGFSSLDGD
jgi:predicted lipoprotein